MGELGDVKERGLEPCPPTIIWMEGRMGFRCSLPICASCGPILQSIIVRPQRTEALLLKHVTVFQCNTIRPERKKTLQLSLHRSAVERRTYVGEFRKTLRISLGPPARGPLSHSPIFRCPL